MRAIAVVAVLSAALALPHAASAGASRRPPPGHPVYEPPVPLPAGQHGDLVWAEEVRTAVPGAWAWRVLYLSTDLDGSPLAVSGLVVAPTGKAPAGGRPVVTWAHGTTGIARSCGPSMVPDPAKDGSMYFSIGSVDPINTGVPNLTKMIEAGWVVAATDYAGLGGPGIHRYLVGPAAARNVLDAAVAAGQVAGAGAGRKTVIFGWSQGGQAAVWAAQMADYVKGRAEVLGAVALAPVNSAAQLRIEKEMAAAGKSVGTVVGVETVMALYASAQTFPELKIDDVLTPFGVEFITSAGLRQCSQHLGQTLDYQALSHGPAVRNDPRDVEAWGKRTLEMAIGQAAAPVPVAVFQGDDDTTVFPAATEVYVKDACAKGSTVSYAHFPRTDHLGIPERSREAVMTWIGGRLEGKPAPSTCP
ncbi:MAG: lipase family protein [Anaeromyxobacteraceae bacterium]